MTTPPADNSGATAPPARSDAQQSSSIAGNSNATGGNQQQQQPAQPASGGGGRSAAAAAANHHGNTNSNATTAAGGGGHHSSNATNASGSNNNSNIVRRASSSSSSDSPPNTAPVHRRRSILHIRGGGGCGLHNFTTTTTAAVRGGGGGRNGGVVQHIAAVHSATLRPANTATVQQYQQQRERERERGERGDRGGGRHANRGGSVDAAALSDEYAHPHHNVHNLRKRSRSPPNGGRGGRGGDRGGEDRDGDRGGERRGDREKQRRTSLDRRDGRRPRQRGGGGGGGIGRSAFTPSRSRSTSRRGGRGGGGGRGGDERERGGADDDHAYDADIGGGGRGGGGGRKGGGGDGNGRRGNGRRQHRSHTPISDDDAVERDALYGRRAISRPRSPSPCGASGLAGQSLLAGVRAASPLAVPPRQPNRGGAATANQQQQQQHAAAAALFNNSNISNNVTNTAAAVGVQQQPQAAAFAAAGADPAIVRQLTHALSVQAQQPSSATPIAPTAPADGHQQQQQQQPQQYSDSFSPEPRSPSSRHRTHKSPYRTYSDESDCELRYPRFDGGLPRRRGAVPYLSLLRTDTHRHGGGGAMGGMGMGGGGGGGGAAAPMMASDDATAATTAAAALHHVNPRHRLIPLLPPSSRRKPMVVAAPAPAEGELPSLPILPPHTALVAYGEYVVHKVLGRGVGSVVVQVSRLEESLPMMARQHHHLGGGGVGGDPSDMAGGYGGEEEGFGGGLCPMGTVIEDGVDNAAALTPTAPGAPGSGTFGPTAGGGDADAPLSGELQAADDADDANQKQQQQRPPHSAANTATNAYQQQRSNTRSLKVSAGQRITRCPRPPALYGLKLFRGWTTYDRAADEEAIAIATVMKRTHCPYLMPCIERVEHPSHCALLFPLCGPSVLDVLEGNRTKGLSKGLPHTMVKSVLFQLLSCVRDLHAAGVIHTDIKPENVLFRSTDTTMLTFEMPPSVSSSAAAAAAAAAAATAAGGSGGGGAGAGGGTSSGSSGKTRDYIKRYVPCPTGALLPSGAPKMVTIRERIEAGSAAALALAIPPPPVVKTVRVPVASSVYVIDLGNAVYGDDLLLTDDAMGGARPRVSRSYIQTRHYRAPEVVFDAGWDHSSDVWSVGCMVTEMLTGDCLFPMHNDVEHMALMDRALGPIPSFLFARTKVARDLCGQYQAHANGQGGLGMLGNGTPLPSDAAGGGGGAAGAGGGGATGQPASGAGAGDGAAGASGGGGGVPSALADGGGADGGGNVNNANMFLRLRSSYVRQLSRSALRAIERQRTVRRLVEKNVYGEEGRRLADLVEGLLRYDPTRRLTAAEALNHPYFTQLW